MCEANAYLIKNGKENLIMESLDTVESQGADSWCLVNIFGDQKSVNGRIKAMNLVEHKILFESL
jgi:predicted RNA-binding protein